MNHLTRRAAAGAAFAAFVFPLGASSPAMAAVDPGSWRSNTPPPNPAVATPASVLGWTPGDDYKLDSWADVTKVYEKLAATSDRVLVEKAGKTTEGHDYLIVYISSPENLKNLKKLQEINLKITDPRKLTGGDAEADELIKQGKTIVALTYGIHSTETASYLGGQLVAYRLASQNDPETKRILDNTVIVLVPARNPDGVDIVKASYDKRLADEASGDDAGGGRRGFGGGVLINKYIGHDDNRDFVGATQPETRIELAKVYNAWHPQIVHDVHQQGQNGSRLTLPPYTAPVEPNIPKVIVQQYHDLGYGIAQDLHAEGYKGVQTGGSAGGEGYDDWSPLRHYVHFHNAVRILEESASVDIASPIEISPDRIRQTDPTPNLLDPWLGGKWTIGDGVSLVQATTYSLLDHAARNREYYLRTSYEIAREAVRPRKAGEKAAFLIPDAPNRNVLLSTLSKGGVEVEFLTQDFHDGDTVYPKGTAVVKLDQPYGGYANALLSKQDYPNLRDPQGNPIRPYDVTAHTISLLYNVPAIAVNAPFTVATTGPQPIREAPAVVVNGLSVPKTVRLALLKSNSQEQGWVRFVFDLNGVKYTEIDNTEIKAGNLRAKYDAIVFPTGIGGGGRGGFGGGGRGARRPQGAAPGADAAGQQNDAAAVAQPNAAAVPQPNAAAAGQPNEAQAPPAGGFAGRGLGAEGEAALKDFVDQGGSVIAINQASDSFISLFNLPVTDITQGLGRTEFYSPGSILETDVDTTSRLAKGIGAHSIVWSQGSPVFQVTDAAQPGQVSVVAKYPYGSDPLVSGWLLGGDKIEGKAALLDIKEGQGHVVLFGFVPHYRGLSLATYPFLFNAISSSASSTTAANAK